MKLSVKICYGKYFGQKKIKKIRILPSSQECVTSSKNYLIMSQKATDNPKSSGQSSKTSGPKAIKHHKVNISSARRKINEIIGEI